jgi:hydroxylaminobenzene mutase
VDTVLVKRLQSWLTFSAALLFGIGVLTGVLVSLAMTKAIAFDPGSTLAAHLNALLGTFWMVCVAWTLPRCRMNPKGLKALVLLVVIANVANWTVTLLKASWQVKGLAFVGDPKNDLILALLLSTVVTPTLGASLLWVWGLRPPFGEAPTPPAP